MGTHDPFLRKYLFGDNYDAKEAIKQLKYQLKVLTKNYTDLNEKFNKVLEKEENSFPKALQVTVHNDEVQYKTVNGEKIMIITGDSLINMIQQVADDLSDVTERVRKLEEKR